MLKELTLHSAVYLVIDYSDLRKGIEGLAAVAQGSLSLDPFNKRLYLFCGRRRDRIKELLWEVGGFLLLYKRLLRDFINHSTKTIVFVSHDSDLISCADYTVCL